MKLINYKIIQIIVVSLSFIITSCSTSNHVVSNSIVQKRKYTKGYHVQLNSKKKSDSKSEKVAGIDVKQLPIESKQRKLTSGIGVLNQKPISSTFVKKEVEKNFFVNNRKLSESVPLKQAFSNKLFQKKTNEPEKKEDDAEKKEVEGFTFFAFIAQFGSLFFTIAGLEWVVLLSLMFIFSIVGLVRMSENPNRYKMKWMAISAFSVSILIVIFLLQSVIGENVWGYF